MQKALIIRGSFSGGAFTSDEPVPDVEGPAELIVYPAAPEGASRESRSVLDVLGGSPRPRTAADIERQLQEERRAWD